MRTYQQLTEAQQSKAREKCLTGLLEAILRGAIRFSDTTNGDNLQQRIDAACEKAEKMQTPWFASEYILDTCREDLEGMASADAEDALYPESNEHVIDGVL